MHDEAARGPRLALVSAHVTGIVVGTWLLALGGLNTFGVTPGDSVRRALLLVCAATHFTRVLVGCRSTNRRLLWTDVGVGLWFGTSHIVLAVLGGSVLTPISNLDVAALEIYGLGYFIAMKSELDRAAWRRLHGAQLYTGGWFRFSRHINAFGEVLMFVGYALLTRRVAAFAIPLVLLLLILGHISAIDRHLARRYGVEFENYARTTKRLMPWIY